MHSVVEISNNVTLTTFECYCDANQLTKVYDNYHTNRP